MGTVVKPKMESDLILKRGLVETPDKPRCHVRLYLMHPGEAQGWIQKGMFERQRGLRSFHVEFLAHLMRTGRFRHGTNVDIAQLGQVQKIVNGQHTLHAIAMLDQPQWITLTIHKVESQTAMAELYTTFDRQLPRTIPDMLRAFGFPVSAGLSARQATMLVGAMRLVLSGLVYSMPGREHRLGYLRDAELLYVASMQWVEEARIFCTAISGVASNWSRYLLRQPLMAVGIMQARYQPEKAAAFWEMVAKEHHADPQHPTRMLARWLQREGLKASTDRQDFVRITAAAWDAFFDERPIRTLNMQDHGRPVHLSGTPHGITTVMRYLSPEWDILTEPMPYKEPLYERD